MLWTHDSKSWSGQERPNQPSVRPSSPMPTWNASVLTFPTFAWNQQRFKCSFGYILELTRENSPDHVPQIYCCIVLHLALFRRQGFARHVRRVCMSEMESSKSTSVRPVYRSPTREARRAAIHRVEHEYELDLLIQVAWFLASPARPCTWQRPGKYSVPVFGCTHSFPNVARVPRSQTRHDRRKRTFITDEQTSLLQAYVFSFLDKFGTREALNFRTIARVATFNSASWQQRPTAGTWNERTWAKLRTKGFQ